MIYPWKEWKEAKLASCSLSCDLSQPPFTPLTASFHYTPMASFHYPPAAFVHCLIWPKWGTYQVKWDRHQIRSNETDTVLGQIRANEAPTYIKPNEVNEGSGKRPWEEWKKATRGVERGHQRSGKRPIQPLSTLGLFPLSDWLRGVTWVVERGWGAKEAQFSLFPLLSQPLSTPFSASFHSYPGNLIGFEWKEAKRGVQRGQINKFRKFDSNSTSDSMNQMF